ncbi:putative bifunctional diguanylate cyclase/phosphodiesterase [Aquabacterium sp. OR-4]|uniref:putative bifunctional diguanylate cyclase/phosphodiesterase n=1 Tax=Aquabacterium sp. OR-4 TaxID=2978127 RepID=UPI0021B26209|nr:bifunctional diguanylate cyclase/phosphodiesterase [Aquabacterium sp. OR-4]MDT7837806.1 bifunctional diguanylate cyclase/phosphodiesterase [Aquabacterium sp. OR-4]
MESLARPLFSNLPVAGAWVVAALGLAAGVVFGVWQWQRARRLQRALQASHDNLAQLRDEADELGVPGLLGRARFNRALEACAQGCDRDRTALVLLFVNLDGFRSVNDAWGYRSGDGVMAQAARRLIEVAGAAVPVGRLGADEFLLLVPGPLDGGCALAGRLCQALARPFELAGTAQARLTCSVGLAAYPAHGSHSRLVGHAAQAMRAVKRIGGDDYMVFEPQMAVSLREQTALVADLRDAVMLGQLELYYQPKVDAQTLQITAAEALLRWHHPQRGMVSPTVFIPLAERHGLIGAIGNWVIEDATRQAAAWRDQGLRMRVAINLSAYQMRQDDLAQRIEGALSRRGLSPGRFTVEITESVAMEDTQVTQRSFEHLRALGLHVSIDDFGVGQASLSYLRRLPAAELKIDASFVQDVATSADARAIVDAVVRMAHALALRVVAEGVETPAQRDALVRLGCDELQGFLFARPMPARALAAWAQLDGDRPPRPGQAAAGQPADRAQFRDSLFHDTEPSAN